MKKMKNAVNSTFRKLVQYGFFYLKQVTITILIIEYTSLCSISMWLLLFFACHFTRKQILFLREPYIIGLNCQCSYIFPYILSLFWLKKWAKYYVFAKVRLLLCIGTIQYVLKRKVETIFSKISKNMISSHFSKAETFSIECMFKECNSAPSSGVVNQIFLLL